jgi:UDP-N-acetylglucosamine acyltransferase
MSNNISPLAYIDPEAKIGEDNTIGPFCYIDRNTVIGDGNILRNSVTINDGARIGNGNEFFPGTSISTKPQDSQVSRVNLPLLLL